MSFYRSPAALQHEAWLAERGIRYELTEPPYDRDEIVDAWETLPADVRNTALKHARRRRDDAEAHLLELLEGFRNGTTGMTTIRTSIVGEGTIGALKWKRTEVSFRYDPELTKLLKERVPADFREWDPDRKIWVVKGVYYIEAFLKAARQRGHDILEPIERGL